MPNENDDDFEELNLDIEEKAPQDSTKPYEPGDRVNIIIRSTIGPEKLEKMTVDVSMPILELKKTVGAIYGLAPEDFHLSILGRTADNEDILSNYDVTEGSELLIIPVSTAGLL
ncbi:MAG: hypothetical protein ACXAC7_15515 [Candidatus Hodarchaeales archaeon]|jgi:hypothetical protein